MTGPAADPAVLDADFAALMPPGASAAASASPSQRAPAYQAAASNVPFPENLGQQTTGGDLSEVYNALRKADAAGDTAGATRLAAYIRSRQAPSGSGLDRDFAALVTPAGGAKYDPTEGNSFLQNALIGSGKMFTDLGLGARQLAADIASTIDPQRFNAWKQSLQQEAANKRAIDGPIMRTVGGKVGDIGTGILGAVPLAAIPGVNGYLGASAIGATYGALSPTTTQDSRLLNTGLGAAFGAGGKAIGNKVGSWLASRQAQPAVALTAAQQYLAPDAILRPMGRRADCDHLEEDSVQRLDDVFHAFSHRGEHLLCRLLRQSGIFERNKNASTTPYPHILGLRRSYSGRSKCKRGARNGARSLEEPTNSHFKVGRKAYGESEQRDVVFVRIHKLRKDSERAISGHGALHPLDEGKHCGIHGCVGESVRIGKIDPRLPLHRRGSPIFQRQLPGNIVESGSEIDDTVPDQAAQRHRWRIRGTSFDSNDVAAQRDDVSKCRRIPECLQFMSEGFEMLIGTSKLQSCTV